MFDPGAQVTVHQLTSCHEHLGAWTGDDNKTPSPLEAITGYDERARTEPPPPRYFLLFPSREALQWFVPHQTVVTSNDSTLFTFIYMVIGFLSS